MNKQARQDLKAIQRYTSPPRFNKALRENMEEMGPWFALFASTVVGGMALVFVALGIAGIIETTNGTPADENLPNGSDVAFILSYAIGMPTLWYLMLIDPFFVHRKPKIYRRDFDLIMRTYSSYTPEEKSIAQPAMEQILEAARYTSNWTEAKSVWEETR